MHNLLLRMYHCLPHIRWLTPRHPINRRAHFYTRQFSQRSKIDKQSVLTQLWCSGHALRTGAYQDRCTSCRFNVTNHVVLYARMPRVYCLGASLLLRAAGRHPLVTSNWARAQLLASLPSTSHFPPHPPSYWVTTLCRRWTHNDSNYRRSEGRYNLAQNYTTSVSTHFAGHPLPFPEGGGEEGRGDRDPHQWSWLPLYTAIAVLAYLLTSTVEPVPEISFPFFLQHMLHAGEVNCQVVGPPLCSTASDQ